MAYILVVALIDTHDIVPTQLFIASTLSLLFYISEVNLLFFFSMYYWIPGVDIIAEQLQR